MERLDPVLVIKSGTRCYIVWMGIHVTSASSFLKCFVSDISEDSQSSRYNCLEVESWQLDFLCVRNISLVTRVASMVWASWLFSREVSFLNVDRRLLRWGGWVGRQPLGCKCSNPKSFALGGSLSAAKWIRYVLHPGIFSNIFLMFNFLNNIVQLLESMREKAAFHLLF